MSERRHIYAVDGLSFKRGREERHRGAHGVMGSDVFLDGNHVGYTRSRRESYTGIKRGGTYTYHDFYTLDGEKIESGSTRQASCYLALRKLGKIDYDGRIV